MLFLRKATLHKEATKRHKLFNIIDAVIRDNKTQKAYAG